MPNKLFLLALCLALLACSISPVNERPTDLDCKAFSEKLAEENCILIDLRTSRELEMGMIAKAVHIDFYNSDLLKEAIGSYDKSANILLYCASGGRSSAALQEFKKAGYQSVFHLLGGMRAWQKAGLPISP